jgi:hypothetical protein
LFNENVIEEEARNLISSLGLKIESSSYFNDSIPETTGAMLVNVSIGEENNWKKTLEEQSIVKKVSIPGVPTILLGGDSFPNVEGLEFLSLTKKSSNLLYWIIGIALVLIIILFLVFRKKK